MWKGGGGGGERRDVCKWGGGGESGCVEGMERRETVRRVGV